MACPARSDRMAGELDPNADLFGSEEEVDPEQAHIEYTFGKNPNRTSALSDLFGAELLETVDEEQDLPEEAKRQLIFKMTANSVLDMVMEAVDPDVREEICGYLDGYIGTCLVNKRYSVDLYGEMCQALDAVKQEEGESDEDFERRLNDLEDGWWTIPQPLLDGRNPEDAVTEQVRRYGLQG